MREVDFNKLAERRFAECLALMKEKRGPEYSRGGDRLSNFRKAGNFQGIAPEKALLGMWAKHIVSIIDLVYDVAEGEPIILEQLREKLTDSINYHVLLEALVEERLGTETNYRPCRGSRKPGEVVLVDDATDPKCRVYGGSLK